MKEFLKKERLIQNSNCEISVQKKKKLKPIFHLALFSRVGACKCHAFCVGYISNNFFKKKKKKIQKAVA